MLLRGFIGPASCVQPFDQSSALPEQNRGWRRLVDQTDVLAVSSPRGYRSRVPSAVGGEGVFCPELQAGGSYRELGWLGVGRPSSRLTSPRRSAEWEGRQP